MRYTVTYEVYIEGDNDKHAFSKAELIAKNQNALHPNQQWDCLLYTSPSPRD